MTHEPTVARHGPSYTPATALAYIAHSHAQAAAGTGLSLAVTTREDDRCVGSIALTNLDGEDPTSGEIGYWTHPDARGRGLMTEAVALLVDHAFAEASSAGIGLRRLVLRAAAGNTASHHVATTAGFVRTGRQRSAERLGDGTWDDLVDYDLLHPDQRRFSPVEPR